MRIFTKKSHNIEHNIEQQQEDVNSNTQTIETEDLKENELIAILTAAVMATMGQNADIKVRVKSYKRVAGDIPIWRYAGLIKQINK